LKGCLFTLERPLRALPKVGRRALFVAANLSVAACVPARTATAREELQQGYALKHAGKCEEAKLWFIDSFHLDAKLQALLYLAECEAQLDDLVAAKRDAAQVGDLALAAHDQALADAARTLLDKIEERLQVRPTGGASVGTPR